MVRALAGEVNANPPLSVRATIRTRRWFKERMNREIMVQSAALNVYLSEDFNEAARAFAEKRKPRTSKGVRCRRCRYGRAAGVDWLCLSGETVGCGPEPASRCTYGVAH